MEIPVCVLSTTKATVQFDPADYLGFSAADGWEAALLLKNNLPSLHVDNSQEGFLCLLVTSAISFCLFNCIRARQLFLNIPGEFQGFSNPVFEFTLQLNLHPAELVMPQVFKESAVYLSGKGFSIFSL